MITLEIIDWVKRFAGRRMTGVWPARAKLRGALAQNLIVERLGWLFEAIGQSANLPRDRPAPHKTLIPLLEGTLGLRIGAGPHSRLHRSGTLSCLQIFTWASTGQR